MKKKKFISSSKLKRNIDFVLNAKYHRISNKDALGALYDAYLTLDGSDTLLDDKRLVGKFAKQLQVSRKMLRMSSTKLQENHDRVQQLESRKHIIREAAKAQASTINISDKYSTLHSSRLSPDSKKWNRSESEKLKEDLRALQDRKKRLGENELDRTAIK